MANDIGGEHLRRVRRICTALPETTENQASLIKTSPETFYKPPYVGVRGWVGIELDNIGDEDLAFHIREAWRLIAPKTLKEGGGFTG